MSETEQEIETEQAVEVEQAVEAEPEVEAEHQTTYDEVLYGDEPFLSTHPDHLAAIGNLFGLSPAHPEHCRMLELGCAQGSNLISMAYAFPGSSFVGVDLSRRQVENGMGLISDMGLENVELKVADILDLGEDLGKFDYIVAHGILSWVPPEVVAKIFELFGELLSPHGIAYLSYNTYPGWKARDVFRDMMLFESKGLGSYEERVRAARISLEIISRTLADNNSHISQHLKEELPQFRDRPDWYYVHDFIADINRPFYFHEVASEAARCGLQYLGDSELSAMMLQTATHEAQKILRSLGGDQIKFEQYSDIAKNRMFRRTLLCRAEVPVVRKVNAEALNGLYFATRLTKAESEEVPAGKARFLHPSGGAIETGDPMLIETLDILGEAWPRALSLEEIVSRLAVKGFSPEHLKPLADGMLRGLFADLIQGRACPGQASALLPEQPRVSRLARRQSMNRENVTSLLHETVKLDDFDREVVALLDGSLSDKEILERLFPEEDLGATQVARLASSLEGLLRKGLIHREPDTETDTEIEVETETKVESETD